MTIMFCSMYGTPSKKCARDFSFLFLFPNNYGGTSQHHRDKRWYYKSHASYMMVIESLFWMMRVFYLCSYVQYVTATASTNISRTRLSAAPKRKRKRKRQWALKMKRNLRAERESTQWENKPVLNAGVEEPCFCHTDKCAFHKGTTYKS